jgi:PAS domain S-box-containing protein
MYDPNLPQRLGFFEALGLASIGMLVVDYSGNIVMANACAEQRFGYGAGELEGCKVEDLVPAGHAQLRESYLQDIKPRSIGVGNMLSGKKKDGSEFPVVIGLSPVANGDEKYILVTAVDITIPHKLQESNKALIQELETTKNELEGFSYSVSHDLRAPLRAIDGYTKILQEDYLERFDEEGKRILSVVLRNVEKMGMLIDDVLRFSRLGRQHISHSMVNMKALALSMYDEYAFDSSGRNIKFIVGDLPEVPGDYAMLQQVWANLIGNALKYSAPREAATIEIQSSTANGIATFTIQDNGVGFNMAYVDKIFVVFQRLHKEKDFKGTGVGLALVQRIIHRHGGTVSAFSVEGQGSTFTFTLPVGQGVVPGS